MSNQHLAQNSMNDLAYIQRLLQKIEKNEFSMPVNQFALKISLFFQSLCLVFATFLAVYEFITKGQITSQMLLSAQDSELGHLGMQTVLIILLTFLIILYFLVWRASLKAQRDFGVYLEVNFKYLKNLSLVSDLIVKFFSLYLLVITGQSKYVSCLLILFIGDYLFQGRYFNLPYRLSVVAGVLSFLVGVMLFYFNRFDLIYPLIVFIIVSLASVLFLVKDKKTSAAE